MKKIYPFNQQSGTYLNYSAYLRWISEKVDALTNYINYFKPRFTILNETMSYITTKGGTTNSTKKDEKDIFWKYKIKSNTEGEEGEIKYCLFPSELGLNESFLNTQPEAFLCYFSPPDAFETEMRETEFRESEIEKSVWDEYIDSGKIQKIPPSYLITSTKWRHNGVQFSGHEDGFDPKNYILTAKPTASWYVINSIPNGLSFSFIPDALNTAGTILNFPLELQPSRYYIVREDDRGWNGVSWTLNAANWQKIYDLTPSAKLILTDTGIVWTGSYPVMHKILFETSKENKIQVEDFIVDHIFETELKNLLNHPTMCYNIHTNLAEDEINSMWKNNIKVLIC